MRLSLNHVLCVFIIDDRLVEVMGIKKLDDRKYVFGANTSLLKESFHYFYFPLYGPQNTKLNFEVSFLTKDVQENPKELDTNYDSKIKFIELLYFFQIHIMIFT